MMFHYLQIILTFLSSISWPIIVLVIFLILQKPLSNLLNNLKKLTYGGTTFETFPESSQKEKIDNLEKIENKVSKTNFKAYLTKFSEKTNINLNEIIAAETNLTQLTEPEGRVDELYNYTKVIILLKTFERIYSIIFGSQIRILQRLNYSISEKIEDLKFYYENAVKVYPETYKDYNYKNYIQFLIANNLVTFDEATDKLSITYFGQDFLRYITESNLSLERRN